MSQSAPYRFSSVIGPDGRRRLNIDVTGPLPDPLVGLTPEQQRAVYATPRSWGEFILIAQAMHYPWPAREAVRHFVLTRRRQRFEARQVQAQVPSDAMPFTDAFGDREPDMV